MYFSILPVVMPVNSIMCFNFGRIVGWRGAMFIAFAAGFIGIGGNF